MAGMLTPIVRWQVLQDGEPVAGAKLYTYLSGTSTPSPVYNSSTISVGTQHANPVVADADGVFPVIYLDALSYRFFVTDSLGATVYAAQDNVYDLWQLFTATTQTANTVWAGPTTGSAAAPTFRALVAADLPTTGSIIFTDNGMNDFRLTLTTAVPVTTADVTAATTIYAAPYKGNRIALYDASGVPTFYTSSQFSIAVPATTVQMYDIFCYASGSTPTLELTAWTNDTTRATAIVSTVAVGVYTKSGDATRRYLGSFRTTGSSGQTEDSVVKRFLWNYYHRTNRPLLRLETNTTWDYTTSTWRQARASTANQVEIIVGVLENTVDVSVIGYFSNTNAGVAVGVAIGLDSTTVVAGSQSGMVNVSLVVNNSMAVASQYTAFPSVGYHYLAWLERSVATGTTTWTAAGGAFVNQSGIVGSWWA